MASRHKFTAITELSAEILRQTGVTPEGGHRRLRELCTDAKLPGAVRIRGRWYVPADGIPEIIEALGLKAAPVSASSVAA